MTVKEALKELKKYPMDAEIYLVKDWEQECDEQGCFQILYRLRSITNEKRNKSIRADKLRLRWGLEPLGGLVKRLPK